MPDAPPVTIATLPASLPMDGGGLTRRRPRRQPAVKALALMCARLESPGIRIVQDHAGGVVTRFEAGAAVPPQLYRQWEWERQRRQPEGALRECRPLRPQ